MFTRRQFLLGVAASAASARTLFTTHPAGAGTPTAAAGGGIVSLTGDARTVGRQFGKLNAESIRHRVRRFLDSCGKRGLSDKKIMERSRPFRRFVAKFAPAWMEEITACANAADVPPERYTAYLAGKYRGLFFVDECTSFCAVGAATADGATLFHKTRDTGSAEQSAYKKQIVDASDPAGFYAVGDTTDMGLMMMMNDHGLAGSADVGGLPEDRPKGRGVMNPEILRLIAERAECCEDALEIVQQMIKDGWYAGGRQHGTHWLFADRFGRSLRVAQNSHEERHWFVEDDTVFLARGKTAGARLVTHRKGKITLRDMNAAASHPDICIDASASALTVRVDPRNPAERSSVWAALPAWAPYVPLFPAARGAPREVVDGAYFRAGYDLLKLSLRRDSKEQRREGFQRRGVFLPDSLLRQREAVQEALYADAEEVQRKIRAASERSDRDTAAEIAAEHSLAACTKAMRFLAEVQQREGTSRSTPG